MDKLTKREKLIEELEKGIMVEIVIKATITSDMLADLIIADRKRICEPLVKYKNACLDVFPREPFPNTPAERYIDEAITLAGVTDE